MGSISKTTKSKRRRKKATNGRANKKARTKAATPKFAIDPTKADKADKG